MTVVGHDATFLGPNVYQTSSLFIGPGEARDALVTAPSYTGTPDALGQPNTTGLGGMVTQMRVYPAGTLGPQAGPNITI